MTHADTEITAELVTALLREQHPDLADLPVELGARGWDNQLWRLGDDLAVRLPWATESADALLRKEFALLPALAERLPLPVPVPRRLGEPSPRFPRPWIVTTWVPGAPADLAPVTRGREAAATLAAFLTALHRPAPEGAPAGRQRGGPLAEHAAGFAHFLAAGVAAGLVPDPDAARALWADALAAPEWSGPAVWLHGDLHPANVLTARGTLCGVVDFGDLCAGDPAYDLSAAWLLLPDDAADELLAAYRPDAGHATVRRARGWALARVLAALQIAQAGLEGRPGGKPTWGPPATAALHRLTA
ncbi:Predicted kinase, aminoglycoside phosphotransferase (APT) family [Streptomyces zhaozhouensis]|uniref:Predicted kinase, aminoglycoside phosphotransferase (APT) family n=1 Tax=Streptomyces zhaozhouensis TaxID=1300267 RepID=A0A286DVC0_9ACTN|nr:aminoglycoside phosphotransferase family protein [Streptomyces zhaozhouensis]SOD62598.1 Predicted kinase, aminoglycoside phosphotransferase (APT) family [Streptomyces zhaozhouensis]